MTYLVQLAAAFAGSLGFALLFRVKPGKILFSALGGLLCWVVYLLAGLFTPSDPIRFLVATIISTLYAELMARACRSPATVFFIIAVIPLVPGGALYTTISYAIRGEWAHFSAQGEYTLLLAAAIALGMLCTLTILHSVQVVAALRRKGQK